MNAGAADEGAGAGAPAAVVEERKWRSRAYCDGRIVAEGFPMADLSEWLKQDGTIVWLDLPDPTPEQLELLGEELGLHALAIEDAVEHQRPKLDRYEHHFLLSAYALQIDNSPDLLEAVPVTCFITPCALVTVHREGRFAIDEVTARWDQSTDLSGHGVGFLVYGLLDYIVDGYFDTLQVMDDKVEELSDAVFEWDGGPAAGQALRRTFELRRGLLTARRVVTPMREVVNSLMRRDLGVMLGELAPYYQDVYDHVLRAADWTDNLRDLIGTIRETHLALQGNRMNLIMKKVTSWAAVIAVPTAITGFYGQNVPYPGFGSTAGVWISTVLMVGISGALYLSFRRRDWL
jgi:magnesium transporter